MRGHNRRKKIGRAFLMLCLLGVFLFSSCTPAVVSVQTWAYDTLCTGKVWGGTEIESVFSAAAQEGQNLLSGDGRKQFFASAEAEELTLGADLAELLRKADVLYGKTGGIFDPTVAPLSELWDVNRAKHPPSEEEIRSRLSLVGWDKLILTGDRLIFPVAGMGIDVGSVGKGYGADRTAQALKEAGATGGVLSFGGNVTLFGKKPDGSLFRIGLRDPQGSQSDTVGIFELTDASVVTTGAYERFFEYEGKIYHHLLDATDGYPRESDLLSVTVVCADGAQADLMTTALWLLGAERGWALLEELNRTEGFLPAEGVFILQDGRVWVSEGLDGVFTLTSGDYRVEAK